mgnify:FL=1
MENHNSLDDLYKKKSFLELELKLIKQEIKDKKKSHIPPKGLKQLDLFFPNQGDQKD